MTSTSFYSNLTSIKGKLDRFSWPLLAKAPPNDLEHPEDYILLTKRIDALKEVQTNLLKVTQNHFPLALHDNNSGTLLRESLTSITNSFTETVSSVASAGRGVFNVGLNSPTRSSFEYKQPPNSLPTPAKQSSLSVTNNASPTPYHEMAVTFANCGLEMGVEEPTGSALYKVATIQQKIGDAKLVMDQHIATDFVQALNVNLNTNIRYIEKARRDVDSLFNTLQVIKERHASAGDEPGPELEFQLTTAQSNYDKGLDVTTQLMTTILNSPDTIKTISELVKAQLAYHQEAHQLLSDIYPQVNDMAAAQIALQSLPPEFLTEVNTPDSNLANMSHCNSSERYEIILSPTISHEVEAKEMDPVSSLVIEAKDAAPEQPNTNIKLEPQDVSADTNTKPEPQDASSETKPLSKSSSSSQETTPTLSQFQSPEKV